MLSESLGKIRSYWRCFEATGGCWRGLVGTTLAGYAAGAAGAACLALQLHGQVTMASRALAARASKLMALGCATPS